MWWIFFTPSKDQNQDFVHERCSHFDLVQSLMYIRKKLHRKYCTVQFLLKTKGQWSLFATGKVWCFYCKRTQWDTGCLTDAFHFVTIRCRQSIRHFGLNACERSIMKDEQIRFNRPILYRLDWSRISNQVKYRW